jgi:hypothetical protein
MRATGAQGEIRRLIKAIVPGCLLFRDSGSVRNWDWRVGRLNVPDRIYMPASCEQVPQIYLHSRSGGHGDPERHSEEPHTNGTEAARAIGI